MSEQCQSAVFFPDDEKQLPQFNGCPRKAETTRRTIRYGDPGKGEPRVISYVVRLCAVCAREFDEQTLWAESIEKKVKAAGA